MKNTSHSIDNLLTAVYQAPWAILPAKLETILNILNRRTSAGAAFTSAPVENSSEPSYTIDTGVAILPLQGTIAQRMNAVMAESGGTSTEIFGQEFDELLENPEVKTIVIDIDSPGGIAYGVPELAAKVFAGREKKRIVAHANTFAASGAYYVASQAHEIIASPSAELGSIGVVGVHTEYSEQDKKLGVKNTIIAIGEHKADGNQYEPLNSDARAEIENRFRAHYDMFVDAVARGRGVTVEHVENTYGQGKLFSARDGVKIGLADRVLAFDDLLNELIGAAQQPAQSMSTVSRLQTGAAQSTPSPAAVHVPVSATTALPGVGQVAVAQSTADRIAELQAHGYSEGMAKIIASIKLPGSKQTSPAAALEARVDDFRGRGHSEGFAKFAASIKLPGRTLSKSPEAAPQEPEARVEHYKMSGLPPGLAKFAAAIRLPKNR